ncbi:MAG: hypothetical protein WCO64_01035 [Actinomycetes bacterium]
MTKCQCGATLLATSLRCDACGRKFTIDANQSGNYTGAQPVDWDAEFDKLATGTLRPARIEQTPRPRGFWARLFRRT